MPQPWGFWITTSVDHSPGMGAGLLLRLSAQAFRSDFPLGPYSTTFRWGLSLLPSKTGCQNELTRLPPRRRLLANTVNNATHSVPIHLLPETPHNPSS